MAAVMGFKMRVLCRIDGREKGIEAQGRRGRVLLIQRQLTQPPLEEWGAE